MYMYTVRVLYISLFSLEISILLNMKNFNFLKTFSTAPNEYVTECILIDQLRPPK